MIEHSSELHRKQLEAGFADLDKVLEARMEASKAEIKAMGKDLVDCLVVNHRELAVVAAGSFLFTGAALGITRPRTKMQAFTVAICSYVISRYVTEKAMDNGWLKFRVRDKNGKLISFVQAKAERDAPPRAV